MIVCVDVDDREQSVVAACDGAAAWTAESSLVEIVVTSDAPPAPYERGSFYNAATVQRTSSS